MLISHRQEVEEPGSVPDRSRLLNLESGYEGVLEPLEAMCMLHSPNCVLRCTFLGESPALSLVPRAVSELRGVRTLGSPGVSTAPR